MGSLISSNILNMVLGLSIGFLELRWIDIVDVLLVGYLMYQIYKLIRGSVALKIFIGIISIYVIFQIVSSLGMEMLSGILGQFVGVGGLAALILFQQEIRKILLLIGKSSFISEEGLFRNIFSGSANRDHLQLMPVIDAAKALSQSHSGALIAFARSTELKFYAETGDSIDAVLSKRLLQTIFVKTSPLHDGAVIISKGRIKAARCILPVSENQDLPPNFGLRHRSALGLSEMTDAVVLVVSEETGQMSIAHDGILEHNLSINDLKEKLTVMLSAPLLRPFEEEINGTEILINAPQ
ncbi:MAG TPA: diadenylate cyclase CdaA [Catalimonadaceae bacterium]|nr:diadenylate cyclase CdaA [Catalimonadaceae bacterium]